MPAITTEDKLVQYLIEARAMEQALVRTLQAHVAMTPTGAYRSLLDRHLHETQSHAERISRRLADLGHGRSLTATLYDAGQRVTGQLLSLGKAPLDLLRGGSGEEKLLKNAKDEAATEALEIATYDAIEQLATIAGDRLTARLAADLRADEERMLAALREQLPRLTAAVVGAEVDGRPTYDVTTTGAAQTAARALREAQGDAESALDAATGAGGEPLPGYDRLKVEQVVRRLDRLTDAQLRLVESYERGGKRRRGVLEAVERRREQAGASEPVGAR
ncbi:ferritin-like domain-containing protein [Conexibacter sp. JD483]|uniref:ferritin-like domain-containing protein n=1 Tax=unclassified Conexibacter TaxID=2627773 RepID=UPI00271E3A83|nr:MULTISPECIES: ferritin-like domain-containing protein [unclassified Conexibacter]MDO8185436.1 ferritin-like domain-containing protein [Conexibacter sp. CPCC 205706]MDO8198388.1 ferritin-like domain-containing protein [Conexibacter sp. CPCC 205762]MDR9369350.1 ferritin-like domain-containing protein [Conexibacter sp. JD483]